MTSTSTFSTFQHHLRGGQNRFSTSGGHFRARNPYFWTSKTRIWSSKTRIWSSETRIWSSETRIWSCEGVLNTGGARPAPAKFAYPPARPAKCAFPSLLVVCFVLFGCSMRKTKRLAPPVITVLELHDFKDMLAEWQALQQAFASFTASLLWKGFHRVHS